MTPKVDRDECIVRKEKDWTKQLDEDFSTVTCINFTERTWTVLTNLWDGTTLPVWPPLLLAPVPALYGQHTGKHIRASPPSSPLPSFSLFLFPVLSLALVPCFVHPHTFLRVCNSSTCVHARVVLLLLPACGLGARKTPDLCTCVTCTYCARYGMAWYDMVWHGMA